MKRDTRNGERISEASRYIAEKKNRNVRVAARGVVRRGCRHGFVDEEVEEVKVATEEDALEQRRRSERGRGIERDAVTPDYL